MSLPGTFPCPRCGEPLPEGFTRCDACGVAIVAAPRSGAESHRAAGGGGLPAWAFLVIGLLAGGAIGYSLRAAVAPRSEGGMPAGPSDMMAGGGSEQGGADAQGMQGGAPMQPNQMMPEVVEALGRYRATLADDPGNVEANIGIGNLMFDAGKWDKAIEHYTKALEKDPKNADVRIDRAVAYHSLGENEKARDEMRRVTREHPDHKNAWMNLGVVSATLGDRKGAIDAWEHYLKLEPSGPHSDAIRNELAQLKGGT